MKLNLTLEDSKEVQHKIGVLCDTPDLQADYNLSQLLVNALYDSIPKQGGEWEVPEWAEPAVKGEMQNHVVVLRDIANDARSGGEMGQSLRINKQAKRFEEMFQ